MASINTVRPFNFSFSAKDHQRKLLLTFSTPIGQIQTKFLKVAKAEISSMLFICLGHMLSEKPVGLRATTPALTADRKCVNDVQSRGSFQPHLHLRTR